MTAMTTGGILKSGWRFTRRSGGVRLSYAALPPGRKRYTAEKIREAFSHSLSKLGFLRAWNRGSGRPRPRSCRRRLERSVPSSGECHKAVRLPAFFWLGTGLRVLVQQRIEVTK